MKDTETRIAFIQARAEGKSYDTIAQELGVSKGTCTNWERELRTDIEALKQAQLDELYTAYNMKRDARIKALGDFLRDIDTALQGKDLDEIPADKLLDLRLKYSRELRTEYIEPVDLPQGDNTLDELIEQYDALYRDAKTGRYTPADIKAQLSILEAKRATLTAINGEIQKETASREDPLEMGFTTPYNSELVRQRADVTQIE